MRQFVLQRYRDISGVSGTGDVARGVVLEDGRVIIVWRPSKGRRGSLKIYDSLEEAQEIHGHDGATQFRFLDD